MKKHFLNLFIFICSFVFISMPSFAKEVPANLSYATLHSLKPNSIERYVYAKALAEDKDYKSLLSQEIHDNKLLRAPDEYIDYVTKSVTSGKISTNLGQLSTTITTEAKVVRSRHTGRILRVENFGSPYASVRGYSSDFRHGGFNINRTSPTSARFSATGQFFIDGGSFSVGGDIVSYSVNLGAKTRVLTVVANMSW